MLLCSVFIWKEIHLFSRVFVLLQLRSSFNKAFSKKGSKASYADIEEIATPACSAPSSPKIHHDGNNTPNKTSITGYELQRCLLCLYLLNACDVRSVDVRSGHARSVTAQMRKWCQSCARNSGKKNANWRTFVWRLLTPPTSWSSYRKPWRTCRCVMSSWCLITWHNKRFCGTEDVQKILDFRVIWDFKCFMLFIYSITNDSL